MHRDSRFTANIGQTVEALFGFEVRLAILLGLVRRVPPGVTKRVLFKRTVTMS